jgi:hypothetical protein
MHPFRAAPARFGNIPVSLATHNCERGLVCSVSSGTALALENVSQIEMPDTDDLFMIHSPEDPDLAGLPSCLVLIPHLTHIAFNSLGLLPINNLFTVAPFLNARI